MDFPKGCLFTILHWELQGFAHYTVTISGMVGSTGAKVIQDGPHPSLFQKGPEARAYTL